MNLITVGKNGHRYRRKFDHEDAQVRYAAGETIAALAREYGVAWAAVQRVVNPAVRKRMDAQSLAYIDSCRIPCLGGCAKLVWMHGKGRTGYCAQCLGEKNNVVRHGTENEYTQGCRCHPCLAAATEAKRVRRAATKVPCSHGCGTMVDGNNRRDNSKPFECRSCYHRRQRGELTLPDAR